MKLAVYREIREAVLQQDERAVQMMREKHPTVSFDTIVSIYAQESSKRTRMNHKRNRSAARIHEYIQRYISGEDILDISFAYHLPPCLLARFLLEHLVGVHKSHLGACLKDPTRVAEFSVSSAVPRENNEKRANPNMPGGTAPVPLRRIQEDLYRCAENDDVSSPAVETIRRITGLEYEALLCRKLREHHIPFQTEDDLRAAGFSKTPDVKLEVPIAVRGRPVAWIDSKASFGDEYNHQTQVTEQFQRYVNRFGPGMVIYWFGFIEELDTHPDILLMDKFPTSEETYSLPVMQIKSYE